MTFHLSLAVTMATSTVFNIYIDKQCFYMLFLHIYHAKLHIITADAKEPHCVYGISSFSSTDMAALQSMSFRNLILQ